MMDYNSEQNVWPIINPYYKHCMQKLELWYTIYTA